MGKFYGTWINITLNNCYINRFFMFTTNDSNIQCNVERINHKCNLTCSSEMLKSSDIGIGDANAIEKGIIEYSFDKRLLINNSENSYIITHSSLRFTPPKRIFFWMDGYAVSLFLLCLSTSPNYVDLVTKHVSHKWMTLYKQHSDNVVLSKFHIKLKEPPSHVMDLIWAKMACNTFHELRQLQYAMSWLSTLGGAFSALGEEQERCAKAAGAISIKQLRIALKLGDKIVITQCKLYFSLSLIQRGYCKLAKKIILEQYNSLKSNAVVDKKTLNMCKGIWARLKYEHQKRRKTKMMTKVGSIGEWSCKPGYEAKLGESEIR